MNTDQKLREGFQATNDRLASLLARIQILETAGVDNSLSVPNLLDESNAVYFYFGWENVNGGWLVQRQNRSTSITESATAGHTNLTDAFADRINLEYS